MKRKLKLGSLGYDKVAYLFILPFFFFFKYFYFIPAFKVIKDSINDYYLFNKPNYI